MSQLQAQLKLEFPCPIDRFCPENLPRPSAFLHCPRWLWGGAERDVPVVRAGCHDFSKRSPSAVSDVDLSFARVVLGGRACQSCTQLVINVQAVKLLRGSLSPHYFELKPELTT